MVTYPTDWTEYSFNDFLKIKRGASPRPIDYYVTESATGVNWIKIGDAPKYGKYIMATKEKITESIPSILAWRLLKNFIFPALFPLPCVFYQP